MDVKNACDLFVNHCRQKLAVILVGTLQRKVVPDVLDLLLPPLSDQYDCDLFVSNEEGVADIRIHNRQVFRADMFPDRVGDYMKPLYVIRHPKHIAELQTLMEQYPGIVLIDFSDPGALSNLISCRQSDTLEGKADGIETTLKKAVQIVVHNKEIAGILEENGLDNILLCSKPVKLRVMVSVLTDPYFTFASYRLAERGDGLDTAIPCIAKLVEKGYSNVRLWVTGDPESEYGRYLKRLADLLGIGEQLQFVSAWNEDETYIRMSRTDVCLHLHEDNGRAAVDELLDVISHGKPAIVLDTESHRELPEDVVCKLSGAAVEEEQLFLNMLHLIENQQLRNKIRRKARAYVAENHSVSRYASRIASLIEGTDCNIVQVDEAQPDLDDGQPVVPNSDEIDGVVEPSNEGPPELTDSGEAMEKEIVLGPNQYRRIYKNRAIQGYFSFDIANLPPGLTIRSAIMHIPVRGKRLRVHRISAAWANKRMKRKPGIRPKPIYSCVRRSSKGTAVLQWDCTELARYWQTGAVMNYGVYASALSAARKPWLHIVLD